MKLSELKGISINAPREESDSKNTQHLFHQNCVFLRTSYNSMQTSMDNITIFPLIPTQTKCETIGELLYTDISHGYRISGCSTCRVVFFPKNSTFSV